MSFNPGAASYPDCASPSWHSQQDMPYRYSATYDMYASGACVGNSGLSHSPTFSPSYNYADSPDMLAFNDSTTPLSPSSSTSSCSSDAPITPYYQPPPLPSTSLLYTGLDKYCRNVSPAETYAYDRYEETDATQTYHITALPESNVRECAAFHDPEYDHAAALRACDDAIAQLRSCDASSSPTDAPPPNYASYDAPPRSFPPHTHAHEYTSSYPPTLCLSPSLLSCSPPTPLKLHQPQPRRSIPVISLAELAASDAAAAARAPSPAPALSPLQLQFPTPQSVGMTSASYLSSPPMAACPSQQCYSCSGCTAPYPVL